MVPAPTVRSTPSTARNPPKSMTRSLTSNMLAMVELLLATGRWTQVPPEIAAEQAGNAVREQKHDGEDDEAERQLPARGDADDDVVAELIAQGAENGAEEGIHAADNGSHD